MRNLTLKSMGVVEAKQGAADIAIRQSGIRQLRIDRAGRILGSIATPFPLCGCLLRFKSLVGRAQTPQVNKPLTPKTKDQQQARKSTLLIALILNAYIHVKSFFARFSPKTGRVVRTGQDS